MKYENKTELFETVPIYKAALTLIVPTAISQLLSLCITQPILGI